MFHRKQVVCHFRRASGERKNSTEFVKLKIFIPVRLKFVSSMIYHYSLGSCLREMKNSETGHDMIFFNEGIFCVGKTYDNFFFLRFLMYFFHEATINPFSSARTVVLLSFFLSQEERAEIFIHFIFVSY